MSRIGPHSSAGGPLVLTPTMGSTERGEIGSIRKQPLYGFDQILHPQRLR